ncbi:MAG TPA: substrate-binding domain-containing protein, partial [Polyangiaceae bacterium]|nr:substrate-binding domain-containing protein [Polyangiaceae bacterium]
MRRAAEEASAASRGRPRPRRIALLTDTLGNSYSDSIVDEVVEVAAGEGVEVVCLVDGLTEYPPRTTLATDNAAPSSVDGVLVLSLGNSVAVEDLVAYCERYRPLPICTMTIPWSAHPRVLIDNEPGMRDGVRHLIRAHGCRRIGFVRGPSVSGEAELRLRVYRDVLAEHDIAYDPALVSPPGSYIVQDGVNAVRTFLEHRKLTLDAIACVNDGAAIGVMQELSARGIVVPDQIAVLGFDDIEVSPYLDAPLTTVRQPIRAQAREACLFLLALIAGERRPTPVLRTELVVRESCGCSGYPQGAAQLAPTSSVPPTWAPIHELCEAFRADVTSGGDAYTKRLKSIVDDAARRGHDVGAYQKLVTAIQLPMTEGLEVDSPDWRRAGALLHESRVLVSDASERAPTMQQLRAEELCIRLNRSVRALLAAEDLASLKRAVAAHLPQFGIGGCFVCVYETDQTPVEWARLVLAWSSGKEISLPEGGLRFPRRELLPEAIAL